MGACLSAAEPIVAKEIETVVIPKLVEEFESVIIPKIVALVDAKLSTVSNAAPLTINV